MLRFPPHRGKVLLASVAHLLGDLFYRDHKGRRKAEKINWAKNVMVGALITSFVLSPTTSAFAQNSPASATPSSDAPATASTATPSSGAPSTAASTESPATTLSAPVPATDSTTPTVPSAASAPGTSTSPPATDSPTTPTTQPTSPKPPSPSSPSQSGPFQPQVFDGTFNSDLLKIDSNTGALTMTYPVTVPPGRNGFQPDVSLLYNSQDARLNSIFGEGWSTKIPYVERLNKLGVDKLYSTSTPNYFISSLDGELATTTASSTYVPRTENGAFNKYVFASNSWVVTDKNGTKFTFGSSTASQQNDPNNTGNVYRWMLEQAKDTNNNIVTYNYFKNSGQIYPSSTIYTTNGTSTGIFEVDFLRESRSDNASSSNTGFWVSSQYRINEIDARVNGSLVHKYALAYTTGANGSTTLLNTITETGWNASGTSVTLPSTTFSYKVQTPGWTSSSTWNPPTTFVDSNGNDNGLRVADALGNNLHDLLQGVGSGGTSTYSAWVDNGAGWTSSSTWNPPTTFVANAADTGVRILDANGDGSPDIIQGAPGQYSAWVNNGNGWTSSSTWNPPNIFIDSFGNDNGLRFADLNGKGLPDMILGKSSISTTSYRAYLDNGSGWSLDDPSWYPPMAFVNDGASANNGVVIMDVNGDGLPDILQGKSGTFVSYINNGHGWTSDSSWNSPSTFVDSNGNDVGVRIADVNGDGLPDIIQGTTGQFSAWVNNGHGWTSSSTWNPPTTFFANSDTGVRIADVNGDGLPDIIQGTTGQFSAWVNNGKFRANILTGITYAKGGSSAVNYQSATQNISGGNTLNKGPYPVYVVQSITNNDGSQDVSSSTYSYSGGTYYYGNPFDTRFAGFATVSSTDSVGNVTKTYYHTSNGTDSSHGEYSDNYWKIGKPYRVENYDSSGNLFKKIINRWDSYAMGGNAGFVKFASSTVSDYDGLGTHKDTAESYTYDNTNGNQTQKVQWGQVTGSDDGTFTDTGTDKFTTDILYATSSTSVIGKPYDITLADQSSNKVKETRLYYDNLALGSASTGNLTKQEDWKTSSTYVNVQNTFDSYGLVTQHQDERGKATTYSFDTYNLYPATSTNALSQSTGYQYDYSLGKTTQTTDPNGNVVKTIYDGLSRPLVVLAPDPSNPGALATSTAYIYTDTANAVAVRQTDYFSATTTVDTYGYYDGLNRPIQMRKSAEDSGIFKVTDRAYNNIDALQKESLPYFASSSTKTSATTTSALFTNYAYDALKRVTTIGNAVGTTTLAYANWKVTTTDARGKAKDAVKDAYGNLATVNEYNGSSTYVTSYTYDGIKDLTNITDALGNVRNFTYDGLGRRLTAQDLHPSTSTTYGTWTYTYDDAANLTQQVDPKSQTVNYTYDDINRILTEDYTGQAGTEFTYTYDTCTNGKTRLCIASSTGAVTSSTYNGLGQLTSETRTIGTSTYTTSYAYDQQGDKLTITNPDNSAIKYTYNTAGFIETVAYQPGGGSSSNVVTNFDYSPTDQVAFMAYANGVNVTSTYDSTKLYRLTQKTGTLPGGSSAQNISYTYDAVGNITQLVDTSASGAGKTVNYTYDDLSRLVTATTANVSTTPSYTQTFTYDALGNIMSGPAGTYTYGGTGYPNPDAVTAISSGSGSSGVEISDGSPNALFHFNASDLTNTVTSTRNGVQGATPVLFTTTSTILGAAAMNDQSTGYYTASSSILDLSGDFTLGFWFVPKASINSGAYFFLRNTGGKNNNTGITYAIACTAGNIEFVHNGTCMINTPQTFTVGTKYFIEIQRQGSRLDAYVNNSLVQSVTDSLTAQSSTVNVRFNGEAGGTGTGYFFADEWFFTKAAISTSTRDSLYASGTGAEICLTSGCGSGATGTTSSTYTYDNNGNLINFANATNTWNWHNQLTQSITASGTSAYAYDHLGSRVKLTEGSSTTLFPTKFYNTGLGGAATTTVHVFANDLLLATVTTVANATSSGVEVSDGSVKALYHFNASDLTDSSGNDRNGTQGGTPFLFTTTSTKLGAAAGNDQNTGFFTATTTIMDLSGDFTIGFWMQPKASLTGGTYFFLRNTSSKNNNTGITYAVSCTAGNIEFVHNGVCKINTAQTFNTNTWYWILMERQGSRLDAYVNNSLVQSVTDSLTAQSSTVVRFNGEIGGTGTGNMYYDEPFFATTAISTSTRDLLYASGTGAEICVTVGCGSGSAGTSTITRYILTDHLNGINVVTDASGTVVETLDYYPYGQARLDSKVGSYGGEKRKYIGQEYDAGSGLSYLNARYYANDRGQFVSEDPSFLAVGDPKQVKQVTGQDQQAFLSDPQQMNSYSYGRDNPITQKDPTGRQMETLILTSPMWGPEVITGIGAAAVGIGALYIGAVNAVKNYNDGLRQRPFDQTRNVQLPESGGPFDNKPPNIDPKWPTWMKWGAGCLVACPQVGQIIQDLKDLKDWTQSFNKQAQSKQDQKDTKNVDLIKGQKTMQTYLGPAQPTSIIKPDTTPNKRPVDRN